MTELKNGGERKALNLTKAVYVDLPELNKPDFEERKPQEYWNYFNNGMELYKKKKYYEAKKEFLKVLSYPNPHNTFRTYLLRTYRKIVTIEINDEQYDEAYSTFKEFFNNCADDITNTDIRKYNKLIGILLKANQGSNYEKMELIEVPEITIDGSKENIELINQIKFNKDTDPRIKNWNHLAFINSKTLYLGQSYNNELSRYNQTFFKVKNTEGKIEKEFNSDHLFYRFNYSETSDKFVWSSDNLIFYLYSIETGFIKSFNLAHYSEDKYHLRCVNISPEGNFLLFTNIDKAYLMNSEFKMINIWSTPHKEGLEKRVVGSSIDRTEIDRNLAVLGLSGNPEKNEIKNAFKKLVIKYHPDRNPDDIGANNKIREIINAYEYLTNENAENVFRESERVEYYSYIQRTKVNIPNTDLSFDIEIGITAPPEDWIYAAYLGSEAKKIYLGCYSGKVYCLSRDGSVKTVYNCHDVIRSIKEKQNYLLIETDYHLHVLKNNKHINHIETGRESILWMDNVFLIKNINELKIYSYDGNCISSVKFKNKIYELYLTKNGLNVITNNRIYKFSLNFDLEGNDGSNMLICQECETENPENAKFCLNCGKKLVIGLESLICSNCGAENPPEARFCIRCGNDLKNQLPQKEIEKNMKSEVFRPAGDINDFKYDLDLLQKFASETTKMVNSKTIRVPKDENLESTINSKIQEIEDEIEIRKKDLDARLKVLSSDLIIITLLKDKNNQYSFTFNVSVDEAELNRYVEFYKEEHSKSIMDTETSDNSVNGIQTASRNIKNPQSVEKKEIKENKTVNKVNWRDRCPVCKSSKLTPRVHKGVLGLTTKNTFECDNCGAVFEEKGQKYKLSKVRSFNDPFWKKYRHQSLTEVEWTRIANGGVSDAEQRKIDAEKHEREKHELEVLKERDINEFLTELQNGSINISTTDSCPVILKNGEETSIVMNNISLREPRAVRQTVGGYAGPSIKVAKGVSFRMGSMAARSESHEELRDIDQGLLVLTNKRLIFIGSKRTTNIDLKKIVAIEPYKDGIASQRENKQKTEYFVGIDKSTVNFTKEGRHTTIPINGIVLKAAIQGNIARLG